MGHGSSIYHVRGGKNEILRLLPGGKEIEVPDERFNSEPADKSFPYVYIFGRANPSDLPSTAALKALGAALATEQRPVRESSIPAGYTYLGQLIFHDVSFLSPDRAVSHRTPALDLDSVLPREDLIQAAASCSREGPLPIGCTTSDGDALAEDLPRIGTGPERGKPLISDPRNDDFLVLAQCHLLLLKFYNAIARHMRLGRCDQVRDAWLKHFQHIVLNDYASRIVAPDIHAEVMSKGRRVVAVQDLREWMPIEFAVAVGRFGHSMIRENYQPWTKKLAWKAVGVNEFMDLSYKNSRDKLAEANGGLPVEWVTNWFRLFDFSETTYSRVAGRPGLAACIDTNLPKPLDRLPQRILADPIGTSAESGIFNLATVSLLRGQEVGLATGQQALARASHLRSRPIRQLTRDELVKDEPSSVRDVFTSHSELYERTPLWYYILKEAEVLGDFGNRLGPLGSLVIMEILHAAVDTSRVSILHEPSWKPDLPRARPDRFTFADIISFTKHPNPLES